MSSFESNPESQPFIVTVKFTGVAHAGKITVIVRELGQWVEYATESNDGLFTIKGKIAEPSFAFVVFKDAQSLNKAPKNSNVLNLFIEPGTTSIAVADSLGHGTIQAGTLQKDLEEYEVNLKALKSRRVNIDEVTKYEFAKQFITQHASSMVSLYAIQNFMLDQSFVTDARYSEELFQLLTPAIQQTQSGNSFHKDIVVARTTAIGAMAPDFVQTDTTGKSLALSALKGKYVLIDFWASWCKPCRAENPVLVNTYNQFKDKNFTIIAVSLDNNKDNWLKAIHKDQLPWFHVSDLKYWRNEVAQLYGVGTIPQNYLLDPNGKIIEKNIKGDQLHMKLKQLLSSE